VNYYPVFLDLSDRRCIVIGGGAVAQRKVEGLLTAGAQITVVSPTICEAFGSLLKQRSVKYLARSYQQGDLEGFALAFVATNDEAVNISILAEARSRGIWVNCADDPTRCDFIMPGVIRSGELTVAVSTGGASPAATRAVREELEEYVTDGLAELVQTALEVRTELRQRSIKTSAEAWNQALKGEFRLLLRQGKAAEAKQLLLTQLEDESCD
jgi:precorrin-2 dehydrogenase/sirohydrochlorin ferrochelatase